MRARTERPEGLVAGTARLVGTDSATIISQVELLINDPKEYDKISKRVNPYGDGSASEKIYNFILSEYKKWKLL